MLTRTLHPPIIVTDYLKDRFFAKAIESPSGCILWQASIQKNGYGCFKLNGRKIDAHVMSWRIAHGGIAVPIGQLVMHSCDIRSCVNPAHLSLGTNTDNMKHAHTRNRGDDFVCRGEQFSTAVLNDNLVRELRDVYAAGGISGRALAERYGLFYTTVKSMLQRKTWKHVLQEAAP